MVMIVDGERRWRGSKRAGKTHIPAIVRNLTDAEARTIQLVANLQREDLHPIEEAEGYDALRKESKLSVDQIAAEVGKSRSYIFGRLKFCALTPLGRAAFQDGMLTPSTALLVARIPLARLQDKAINEITDPPHQGEPLSYRAAMSHIQSRYMLDLTKAPFMIDDASLVAQAGACGTCPNRTGNQPDVFLDIKSADVCTDPDCFAAKKGAHNDQVLAEAEVRGIPVHDIEEARKAGLGRTNLVTNHVHLYSFERRADVSNHKSIDELLEPADLPEPISYVKGKDGALNPVFEKTAIQSALEKAGLCLTLEEHTRRQNEKLKIQAEDPANQARLQQEEAEAAELEARAAFETSFRLSLYRKIIANMFRIADGHTLLMSRSVVKSLVKNSDNPYTVPDDLLPDLYPCGGGDDDVCTYIDQASHPVVGRILIDILIGDALLVDRYELADNDHEDGEPYALLMNLANDAGIDVDAVRRELQSAATSALAPEVPHLGEGAGEGEAETPTEETAGKAELAPPAAAEKEKQAETEPPTPASTKGKKKKTVLASPSATSEGQPAEADAISKDVEEPVLATPTASIVDEKDAGVTADSQSQEIASDLGIGDRVRISNNLYGPTGKRRACCGREGTIAAFDGTYYSVKTGPKKADLINDLVWNEITRSQPVDSRDDAAGEPAASTIDPSALWPFPKGSDK